MPTLIEIIILGIIQGITEWLPVSSSGHLVLAEILFHEEQPLIFAVMLHFGTVIVILFVFRKEVIRIITALVKRDFASEDGRMALYVILGTILTGIAGIVFRDPVEALFKNPLAVAVAMLFTGGLLFVSERRQNTKPLGFIDSIYIAVAQTVSIIPGISRSGSTISTGLLRGVDKEKVFRFSFILAAPAILGATILEARDAVIQGVDLAPMLLGVIISMIVGYISLKTLRRILLRQKLHYFAYYCWALGLIVILFLLLQASGISLY
jgi:undecaprenyl-diphosphatase